MSISPLTGSSTFYDWYLKTNDEIIAQLNQMTIYGATSGTDIRLNVSSNILTALLGSTLGNISSGLTFNGKVSFTGEAVMPNVSFKITGITLGTSGYTFGSVIRSNGLGFTLAKANDPDNAESIGVISSMNPTYSVVTMLGKITGNFTTSAGGTLSPGCIYFLDPTTAGTITTSEPVTVGQVSKPIIMGLSADAGIVLQYRGNYLNGSSSAGVCGGNRLYIILPSSSASNGFEPGVFVSYLPNVGTKDVLFDNYLVNTGRTAYDGWFVSQSTSTTYQCPIPYEEDFVIGLIESSATYGTDKLYQIVTKGATEILPGTVASNIGTYGWWYMKNENVDPTDQLYLSSNNIEENSSYERLYVGYNYNDTSFVVDIRPQIRSITSTQAANFVKSSESLGAITNEAFNGDFSVWQRSAGRDSQYTTNTSRMYFADQWIRRTSRTSSVSQYIERKTFDKAQILVEGSPTYYIDAKCLVTPGITYTTSDYYRLGHVIPGIESFNNSDITVSFYAKCSHNNYDIDVYVARYNGTTLVSKDIIDTISPTTTWDKYVVNHTMSALSSGSYSNDFVEIGFDLRPLTETANTNSVAIGTNVFVSFASLCVYKGTYSNPKHLFEPIEDKKVKANRYYFTSYTDSQTAGTSTLTASGEIALNSFNVQYSPTAPYAIQKFPITMRTSPTLSLYSPSTGALNDGYNINASLDMRQTSGTIGYNQKTRTAALNSTTISATADTTSFKVNLINGVVPYDNVSYHIIADASYPL
jgi:hypothetical protein